MSQFTHCTLTLNFLQRWRHNPTNVSYVLQELVLWPAQGPLEAESITILDSLAGQPLKKFSLVYFGPNGGEPRAEFVQRIATSFPQLQELTLITMQDLNQWPDELVRLSLSTSGDTCLTLPAGRLLCCITAVPIIGTAFLELLLLGIIPISRRRRHRAIQLGGGNGWSEGHGFGPCRGLWKTHKGEFLFDDAREYQYSGDCQRWRWV